MSYAEILALAQDGRGGRLRGLLPIRPLRELSGRRRAARRRTRGRRSPAWRARRRRINLGVLVSPVTFRLPGNLAKVVTTVAEMSGGRVELGLGAGWNELEHRQHGLRFPPTGERFDMLEEQLAIVHGLWTEPDGWSLRGPALAGQRRAVLSQAGRSRRPPASEPDRRRQRPARGWRASSRATPTRSTSRSASPRAAAEAYERVACRVRGRWAATRPRSRARR